jgi:hypothetical protein
VENETVKKPHRLAVLVGLVGSVVIVVIGSLVQSRDVRTESATIPRNTTTLSAVEPSDAARSGFDEPIV